LAAGAIWQYFDAKAQREVAVQQKDAADQARNHAQQQLDRANFALAQGVWNNLNYLEQDRLTPDELNSLWSLTADAAVRAAFVELLKTDRGNAVRFGRRPETVIRALGLDWPSGTSMESLVATCSGHEPDGRSQ